MHAKRIVMTLSWAALFALAGPISAETRPADVHTPDLSHSERMRMRGDVERFSQEHPDRARIDKRRQMLRERAKRRFHEADHDGNGRLNRHELARQNPNAARHFEQIDRDRDGEISEFEFAQALRRRMRMQDPHRLAPRQTHTPNSGIGAEPYFSSPSDSGK